MELSTQAIVLNTTKYGETSVVLHAYTQDSGLRSFMAKGVRSPKRSKSFSMGMFQPLTQLELISSAPKHSGLSLLKSAKINPAYTTIPLDITKSSICLFLAEVLRSVLKEEEQNNTLYSFLSNALAWMDTHNHTANVHILILIQLTKYLGFYPDISTIEHPYFDIQNGHFCPFAHNDDCVSGNEILLFKSFLGTKFDELETILISADQRRALLRLIMRYYKSHVQSFREPKSLEILYEVFNS
ncbi:MAG: DNA repair protein RecO [Flavobacteriaceae bacterium]